MTRVRGKRKYRVKKHIREIQPAVEAVDDVLNKLAVFDQISSEEELDQIMPDLLASLGRYSVSDRAYIFTWTSAEHGAMQMTHEWCADGVSPTIGKMQRLQMCDIPNWYSRLKKGEAIISKDWEAEKKYNPEEYAVFDGQEIHSLIIIPVFANKTLNGYIGFDNPEQSRAALSVRLLSSIGGHISSLKDNFFMMKELERKQENLKQVIEEQERQKKELEKTLSDARVNSEIVSSISKLYWLIYRMDLVKGTYEEISAGDEMHRLTGKSGSISEAFKDAREMIVSSEYREMMNEFMDMSTLAVRLQNAESIAVEYQSSSGSWHLARFIVKKRDESGKVTNVLYVVRQIDKEKQMEISYKEKILESSRVLAGLSLDYTIAFILNLDTDEHKIIFTQETNHAKRNDITKFADYVDGYARDFVLPELQDAMRRELNSENIKKHFETEDEYYFSFETVPNAAGLSCFQAHIVKEYDGDDHLAFLGFRSVDEIVKQDRFYKEKLREANYALKKQLDMVTNALPGGVKISNDDAAYSFKYVSEQFANMLGYETPEELMEASGGNIVGLAHPDDVESGIAEALRQYERSDHYEITYRMKCKDGSWKYIEDRGHKFYTPEGTVEHWNLILDNHELMEKTIALESEKRANQSKSDFLSRMSHDMRTPLNGIMGLLKINQDHFDDRELVKENHKKMQVSADHLLSLINDVLEMSKIEDGSVTLTHEVIDFVEMSYEIATIIGERAAECDIQLEFERRKAIPYPHVYGSPVHLRQIFLNIYSNCIKYNRPGGKITTVTDLLQASDGICVYRWTISDTGIGMSEEFLEHIFEPFVQEREDARSAYQGIGLGMAIVKGLIKKMGGTIQVESEEGKGSTFVITIPFEIASSTVEKWDKRAGEAVSIQDINVMLVEDNELNAEIAETMLKDQGANVTVTSNGKQAVTTFEGSVEGTFDVILMDIMMPVMDGLTAARTIRNSKHPDAKTIPIIAMTANAFKEDEIKCLEAGMNAHLAKPLDIEKLKQTIDQWRRR